MGLLPDTQNCGLRMRRECWERFPRYRFQRKLLVSDPGMHHGTCVRHVPRCMSGSLTRGDGENVPGIPGTFAILRIWQEAHRAWIRRLAVHFPTGRDIFCLKNFDIFSRSSVRESKMNAFAHAQYIATHFMFVWKEKQRNVQHTFLNMALLDVLCPFMFENCHKLC